MKGGNFDENQFRQDILEDLIHTAGHPDSREIAAGDFIAANNKVLASTEITNSLYYSVSGIICKTQLEIKKYLEQS